jgi:hypothetical protein
MKRHKRLTRDQKIDNKIDRDTGKFSESGKVARGPRSPFNPDRRQYEIANQQKPKPVTVFCKDCNEVVTDSAYCTFCGKELNNE